jgi:hypothetical protein
MRGGRSLLVLLVLAIGLGAYIYFVESERDPDNPDGPKEKLFAIEEGTIEEIVIHAASGETTTVRKTGDVWGLTAPVAAPADEYAVSSLASAIERLEIQKILEENPASVEAYGLAPARFSVAFKVKGEENLRKLNVGRKTPTGSDAYAQVEGQPRLFLISGFLEDSFNRTPFDLRDKTVLAVNRDGLDAVTLEKPGAPPLVLARKAGHWRLVQPVDAKADAEPVDSLVERVASAKMTAIVGGETAAPTPAELRSFGLDRPRLVATFGAGSSRATLALGGTKDEGSIYARDLARPLVFTVEAALLTDLTKTADDLRAKDIFDFKSFSALELEVTQAGTSFAFSKSSAPAGALSADVWKATKPAAKDVNQTAMTDFLNTLSSIRAVSFVPRQPAGGDALTVRARFGDAQTASEERVTLRKVGGIAYALRDGESGAAVVPVADFDKALEQLKTLTASQ